MLGGRPARRRCSDAAGTPLGDDQRGLYIPVLAVDRARDGFRGKTKTDRRDDLVIAEQARMRRDLKPLEPADELLSELGLLLSRRRDLVVDQSWALQRIRDAHLASFPGLERALPKRSRS